MASLLETHQEIAQHCAEIADLFKPGARVTVIVRNPGQDIAEPHSGAMLVGDDDLQQVAGALEHLRKRGEVKLTG